MMLQLIESAGETPLRCVILGDNVICRAKFVDRRENCSTLPLTQITKNALEMRMYSLHFQLFSKKGLYASFLACNAVVCATESQLLTCRFGTADLSKYTQLPATTVYIQQTNVYHKNGKLPYICIYHMVKQVCLI